MSIWVSLTDGTKTDVKEIKVSDPNSGFTRLDVKRAFVYKDENHPRVELFPATSPAFSVTPIVDDVSPNLAKNTPVGLKITYNWSRNESCSGASVYFCHDRTRSETSSDCPGQFTLLTTCCRTAYAKSTNVWVVDKGIDDISNPLYKFASYSNCCYRIRHAFLSKACLDFCDASWDDHHHRWGGCFWICMCDDNYLNASRGYTVKIACCNNHVYKVCNFSYGGLRRFCFCYSCLKDSPETHITIIPKSELGDGVSCQLVISCTSTAPPTPPTFICWTNIGSSSSHLCLCQTCPQNVDGYRVVYSYKCNYVNSNGYYGSREYSFTADKDKEKFSLTLDTALPGRASFFESLVIYPYRYYIVDLLDNTHYGKIESSMSINVAGLPVGATPAAPNIFVANMNHYGHDNVTFVCFNESGYGGVPAYYYYLCANFSGIVKSTSHIRPKNTSWYDAIVSVDGYASQVSYKIILCNCYQHYFNSSKFKYKNSNFVRSYSCSLYVPEKIYY